MQNFQFTNFESVDDFDKPVYRIMPQEYVFALFRDGQNAISKFSNWKDNFENFLMRCGHEFDGVKHDNTVRDKMVAQCWTKEKYSEAMWGIYANDPDSRFLRIKSTPRKLLNALNLAQPPQSRALCRVGEVVYKSRNEIKLWYNQNKGAKVNQELLFQSLLMKRKAFSHEREVRLMCCALFGSLDAKGLFWYKVNPHEMSTQIMADPNRDRKNWRVEKEEIQSKTRFRGSIKRSKIYDFPSW